MGVEHQSEDLNLRFLKSTQGTNFLLILHIAWLTSTEHNTVLAVYWHETWGLFQLTQAVHVY